MGRLTDFTGGQIVTDSSGTGERQIQVVSALPMTPESGIIYMTPSTISNSVEITGFTGPSSLTSTQTDVSFVVTGDDGAEFEIETNLGGETGLLTIGSDVTSGVSFTSGILTVNVTGSPRDVIFTILPNPSSEPETILDSGLDDTITLTQPA